MVFLKFGNQTSLFSRKSEYRSSKCRIPQDTFATHDVMPSLHSEALQELPSSATPQHILPSTKLRNTRMHLNIWLSARYCTHVSSSLLETSSYLLDSRSYSSANTVSKGRFKEVLDQELLHLKTIWALDLQNLSIPSPWILKQSCLSLFQETTQYEACSVSSSSTPDSSPLPHRRETVRGVTVSPAHLTK